MKTGIPLPWTLLLCLFASLRADLHSQEVVYASNSLGMQLEALRKGMELPDYRLVVTKRGNDESRRLLNREGEELKRWVLTRSRGVVKVEEFKEGKPLRVTLYDEEGKILKEQDFEGDGGTYEYTYQKGRLAGFSYTPSVSRGSEEFQQVLLYDPRGMYRGVLKRPKSGNPQLALVTQDGNALRREVFEGSGLSLLVRYNSWGEVSYQEVRKDGVPMERSLFWYDPEAPRRLRTVEREDPLSGTRKVSHYSAFGLLEKEIETLRELFIQSVEYVYDEEKRLVQKEQRTRRGSYRWEYRYSPEGRKTEEIQHENGELSLRVEYEPEPPYTRVESRYKQGRLVMRVFFKEEMEALVEYYREGTLIRSVKKGTEP